MTDDSIGTTIIMISVKNGNAGRRTHARMHAWHARARTHTYREASVQKDELLKGIASSDVHTHHH